MPTTSELLLVYQLGITLFLLGMVAMTLYNLRRLVAIPVVDSSIIDKVHNDAPVVSVLVPARNEERSIRACVESLLQQTYNNTEVIVLNDNSTDSTEAILHELCQRYPGKLRVINGAPLPADWVGKNWACHQLYKAASGSILLFTDADTVHHPATVASTYAFMQQQSIDCLSLIPYEIMDTAAERMVLPFVHVSFLSFFPISAIMRNPRIPISAANGQFLMFTRAVYERTGGHKALKNNIVEDLFFARRLKAFQSYIYVADGSQLVSCRMYTSFREVFLGFSKNLYPAMSANPAVLASYLGMNASLFLGPLVFFAVALAAGLHTTEWLLLPALQLALSVAVRFVIGRRFRMPATQCLLYPPAALLTMAISINSALWYYSPRGMQWKGRQYDSSLVSSER